MAMSPKLEIRQGQSLVMTPQLMQAIKLLQMSSMDLISYVDAELEKNPLLERADAPESAEIGRLDQWGDDRGPEQGAGDAGDYSGGDDSGQGAQDFAGEQDFAREQDLSGDGDISGSRDAAPDWLQPQLEPTAQGIADKLDTDVGNVFPDDDIRPPAGAQGAEMGLSMQGAGSGGGGAGGDDEYNLEAFVAAETSLHDHLEAQLNIAITDPVGRLIGRFLIDMVDETGYLVGDLADLAVRLDAPLARVESVLATIQTFDPSGIAARSLKECIAIQLREKNRFDPAIAALVEHLELLAKRDMAALRRICGVDDEDLLEMMAEIRAVNPKPGLAFGSVPMQPVVPDVVVRVASDGGWAVELNTEVLPRVLVNQSYYANISRHAGKESDKTYLSDCLQTANWLVKSLDQRARTILKVASEIVRQQDAFLAYGVEHLRPINLKTIADQIGMHESTVSRVTSSKYMATPRGIFEMKYFFTSAIASAHGGEAHSAESVRWRIKQLIDAEEPSAILSDDAIVDILQKAGMDIARRTVAKYRESMKIPSSVERRRQKGGKR